MRHCMVVYASYPLGETRVQREAEVLLKHGYQVDVICIRLTNEKAIDNYKGVKIWRQKHNIPISIFKSGGLSEKLIKYLRFFITAGIRITGQYLKNGYSTIQVHNMPDFLIFITLIPKLMGVPIVLDIHDLMPEFYAGRYGNPRSLILRVIKLQERLACRFSNHVITVSELWKNVLIERGVPEGKCSVVMNVADENIFHSSEHEQYKIPTRHSFRLIYHGVFVKRNGLDLAIQAIHRVCKDIPEIHLSLIGSGEYLPDMNDMIEDLGLHQFVSISKPVLAENLPEIIMSCHLGIVPIRSDVFTDTALPTKLMEYAALGLPAIAASTTANLKYFSDANTEFFEPGNVDDLARCILMLYHNPERLAELACKSANFNKRYNWTINSAEYVSLVNRLGRKWNVYGHKNRQNIPSNNPK